MSNPGCFVNGRYSPSERCYRKTENRVFVNRELHLEDIKYIGFDMDYTLAEYKSPQLEQLILNLAKQRLVDRGYPKELLNLQYDSTFPVRGLWFDKLYGNLLKVDSFGNILVCIHGFTALQSKELWKIYPNKFLKLDNDRVYVLNTLYDLPLGYLLAAVVDYFTNSPEFVHFESGINAGEFLFTYKSIFHDVQHAIQRVHSEGDLLRFITMNLDYYVKKDKRLPLLLSRLRDSGVTAFILTDSDYQYTNKMMTYLFDLPQESNPDQPHPEWQSYFGAIVVNARKSVFFDEGTVLRQVDLTTGDLKIGTHIGPLHPGQVYSGGSCEVFTKLINARGMDVLYVGDHMLGDIINSKKIRGWRTCLIVPELENELRVWTEKGVLFDELQSLNIKLNNLYHDLDSSTNLKPDTKQLRARMCEVAQEMDNCYGVFGSVFRQGSHQTFFTNQVVRYADIYTPTFLNLLYYPFSYLFLPSSVLLPHESTVRHCHAHEGASKVLRAETHRSLESTQIGVEEGAKQKVLEKGPEKNEPPLERGEGTLKRTQTALVEGQQDESLSGTLKRDQQKVLQPGTPQGTLKRAQKDLKEEEKIPQTDIRQGTLKRAQKLQAEEQQKEPETGVQTSQEKSQSGTLKRDSEKGIQPGTQQGTLKRGEKAQNEDLQKEQGSLQGTLKRTQQGQKNEVQEHKTHCKHEECHSDSSSSDDEREEKDTTEKKIIH